MSRPRSRWTWVWIAAAAGAVLLLAAAAFTWYTFRDVEVRTGVIVVTTDGRVIEDSTKTIKVPAADAGRYSVTKRTVDPDAEFSALFGQAQSDIARGDMTAARAALTLALTYKPDDPTATAQLKDIAAGKKPKAVSTPGGGSTAQNPKPKPTTPTAPDSGTQVPVPAPQLSAWAPDTLAGYKAGRPTVDELTVSRQYTPVNAGSTGGLVIVVQQYSGASAAADAIARTVRVDYPADAAQVKVGNRQAYFGTDGRRFAVLALNADGTLVTLELDAGNGKPSALSNDLTVIAAKLGK